MRGRRIPGDSCGKTGDPRPRSVGFHEGGSGVRPRKASGIRPHELHKKKLAEKHGVSLQAGKTPTILIQWSEFFNASI
ncbi:hypothetical protein AAV35_012075 [Salimicrobium jeotgali]|uniref:Uncharacterized protein n=1 Tax=Salimicrobium jeotgali TaxID=1230341 RepID=A0AAC8PV39_9BACI|nr:hypothetical protein AAV35_012075 [Salimicrobium jeotgali]